MLQGTIIDKRPKWLKKSHGNKCDCASCYNFKQDILRPNYLGPNYYPYVYECLYCKQRFSHYKTCAMHMGRIPNIMGTCPVFDANLKCLFCFKKFSDFGPLGAHVAREHKTESGIIKDAIILIDNGDKEETDMLPAGGEDTGRARSKRGASGIPFLNGEEMLTKTPKEAKILAVRYDAEHKFGPTVNIKLALDGQTVMWGLRVRNNPNLKILTDKFGRDENDWAGERILLYMEKDEFTEQWYPRVSFPETPAKTKAQKQ